MAEKRTVIWDDERNLTIPAVGRPTKGDTVQCLTVEQAESFVKQGLAKWPSKPKKGSDE